MRKLKVDLAALEFAIEDVSGVTTYYLDITNGAVIQVRSETRRIWARIYDELSRQHDATAADFSAMFAHYARGEVTLSSLQAVHELETNLGSRYLRVPRADSRKSYEDIEEFITTIADEAFREKLTQALGGQGAFRRFKEMLAGDRHERERWFRFKNARMRQRVNEWLSAYEIDPVMGAERMETTDIPPVRMRLLQEMGDLVHALMKVPGVTRIALIGSLATDVEAPRDADLLISVNEDANLTPLAKLGRRWRAFVQSLHCSGDIFLCDEQGNYLGRTCPWKDCGAGLNPQCDARHCSRRRYLHDDLNTIRLSRQVVSLPPIELWPEIILRAPVPQDVDDILVKTLRS